MEQSEEKKVANGVHNPDKIPKAYVNHAEELKDETVHDAAERGHAATDR
jgi:hypothetical protein